MPEQAVHPLLARIGSGGIERFDDKARRDRRVAGAHEFAVYADEARVAGVDGAEVGVVAHVRHARFAAVEQVHEPFARLSRHRVPIDGERDGVERGVRRAAGVGLGAVGVHGQGWHPPQHTTAVPPTA